MSVQVIHGDAIERLRELPADSVHCVVTSPPYFGLRDYGTGAWEGGDLVCDHDKGAPSNSDHDGGVWKADGFKDGFRNSAKYQGQGSFGGASIDCGKCGARRIDRQIGLEPTPEAWAARLVEVFREVRRVLRPDGVLFR